MIQYKKPRLLFFVVGLLTMGLGVFMLFNPLETLIRMLVFAGILFLVFGIILLIDALAIPDFISMRSTLIFEAFMTIILGLILVFGDQSLNIGIITYIFLFTFVLSSFIQIQFSVLINRNWLRWLSFALSVLDIALSVYMFMNPNLAQHLLVYFMAFGFISSGINRMLVGIFDL